MQLSEVEGCMLAGRSMKHDGMLCTLFIGLSRFWARPPYTTFRSGGLRATNVQ